MTLTEYECRITEIIDELRGDGFDWPESREGDIRACFMRHMTPEQAATKLLADWEGTTPDEGISATEAFGLSEIGRVTIDGRCWVMFDDEHFCHVVDAGYFDDTGRTSRKEDLEDRSNDYTSWCQSNREKWADDATAERVARELGCVYVHSSDGCGRIDIDLDDQPEYRIAFVRESGDWDVVETFHAADDDAAREYAESEYGENDVFVLDHTGRNIDGGPQ